MTPSTPTGTPSCPDCDVPGEQTDTDPSRNLRLFTCYNSGCGTIEYDQHGGTHHSVSDPHMKREFLDEDKLW